MRRLVLCSTFLLALSLSPIVTAQDGSTILNPVSMDVGVSPIAQTESMWFYLQELRRYDDPRVAIRRNAEQKSAQRRHRLAAQKWFGWSQSRPTASPTPWTGVYSPSWVGNGADPFYWVGNGYVATAVRVNTGSDSARR